MARITDPNKLERIKQATLETIVQQGLEKTTISTIARAAGVSEGYLYRHYAGKQELIEALFQERVEAIQVELNHILSQDGISLQGTVESFVRGVVTRAIEAPDASKFYYTLLHNYNFEPNEEQRERMLKTLERMRTLGLEAKQIYPGLTLEELYLCTVMLPIDNVHLKMRRLVSPQGLSLQDIPTITRQVLRALGNDDNNH